MLQRLGRANGLSAVGGSADLAVAVVVGTGSEWVDGTSVLDLHTTIGRIGLVIPQTTAPATPVALLPMLGLGDGGGVVICVSVC